MTGMQAEIAIIGGSGLYSLFADADTIEPVTTYGSASSPISIATVAGRRVAFLARHGVHHEFPPHSVPYRANIAALNELGVRQIIAPCAVGSLKVELNPGTLVVPDQLVDRTSGRSQTFYDRFETGTKHASFADPYCQRMRASLLTSAAGHDWDAVDGAAMVVIDGPRFSTRAESQWYAAQGWSLVNMTGHPEAVLARELGICYAALALVTDVDAGLAHGEGVSEAEVFAVFAEHTARLRTLLVAAVEALPVAEACGCG